MHSYLGDIDDSDYISFASFCRGTNDNQIDFEKYVCIWNDFDKYQRKKNSFKTIPSFSQESIDDIILYHPKGGQLSIKRIGNILKSLPRGKYILIRTEKKPKKYKNRIKIENRFGMKKWKTGKIKIVPIKYRITYIKLAPYVSIFEFEWKG